MNNPLLNPPVPEHWQREFDLVGVHFSLRGRASPLLRHGTRPAVPRGYPSGFRLLGSRTHIYDTSSAVRLKDRRYLENGRGVRGGRGGRGV